MIAAAKPYRLSPRSLKLVSLLLGILLTDVSFAAERWTQAPNRAATPVNQLVIGGNACGPAALLNAFKMGSTQWQMQFTAIEGNTDKERLSRVIRHYGLRPSAHVKGRPRYSRRGINVADLTDVANEIAVGPRRMPTIVHDTLFLRSGESPNALLRKTHRQIQASIARGFPPLLSLRRHELQSHVWSAIDAHFVTVVAVPTRLAKQARSFPVSYIDPWRGILCEGHLAIPDSPVLVRPGELTPCLIAVFPEVDVGKKRLKPGSQSEVVPSALIGRW